MKRIDFHKGTDLVDDVAISATLFRLEQMDDDWFWIAAYTDDRKRVCFHLKAIDGKIECRVVEDD